MIYATNFDNYTYAMLHPTCGSATPAQQIIDHAWYYCSTFTTNGQPGYDAGVVMVPGHSGQAVQFHYDGVLQESHGIELTGGTNTGSATSIIQHWGRLVADPGEPPITDVVVAAKIKWIELWHNDPGNNRIQFNWSTTSAAVRGTARRMSIRACTTWAPRSAMASRPCTRRSATWQTGSGTGSRTSRSRTVARAVAMGGRSCGSTGNW